MNALPLTIVGNLTGDPELRFTASGVAVARLTIAHTPRIRREDQWEDGEPTFLDCSVWRHLAENVAESLTKGARVIASGRLETQRWEQDGEKRSRMVLQVDAIGPDLTYATAAVKKMARRQETAPDDPWATAGRTRPENHQGQAQDTEPPF